jgi:hypothetical protein
MTADKANCAMRLSVALLIAHLAVTAMTLTLYRVDWLYRTLVATNRALMVSAFCVGIALFVWEVRCGRLRNAIWPALVVLWVVAWTGLFLLGEMSLSNRN